ITASSSREMTIAESTGLVTPPRIRRQPLSSPLREAHDVHRGRAGALCCGAGVVDDVVDGADASERDREEIVELHPGGDRDLDRPRGVDRRVDVEEAVASEAPCLMGLDVV